MTQNGEQTSHVGRRLIDVSTLPTVVYGHRDPLWWGVWMLIMIEGTMFSLLLVAYLYLRGNFTEWPPTGAANPPLLLSITTVSLLLISCIPIWLSYRAALHKNLRVVQLGMVGVTILSILAAIARAYEMRSLNYNWNSHAYGSIVWAIYFMHTFHVVSGVVENGVLTTLLYRGPVEKKHMLDVRLGAIYWWFVVGAWVVFWALVQLDDVLFRNSLVS